VAAAPGNAARQKIIPIENGRSAFGAVHLEVRLAVHGVATSFVFPALERRTTATFAAGLPARVEVSVSTRGLDHRGAGALVGWLLRASPQTGQRVSWASLSWWEPDGSRQLQCQAVERARILRFGWTFELNTISAFYPARSWGTVGSRALPLLSALANSASK
jgi:hypothetical protein